MAALPSPRTRISVLLAALSLALIASFGLALPTSSLAAGKGKSAKKATAERAYFTPFRAGTQAQVTCGAAQDHHTTDHPTNNYWDWDFVVPAGTAVAASATGVVTRAGKQPDNWGWGIAVEITHPSGRTTIYAHLSREDVRRGQTVRRGQAIGVVGDSGRSNGAHLHFGVHNAKGLFGGSLRSALADTGFPQTGATIVSGNRLSAR
jgi:murein DD-endopeptidase MepM/ murein hydrolase activator NlpD